MNQLRHARATILQWLPLLLVDLVSRRVPGTTVTPHQHCGRPRCSQRSGACAHAEPSRLPTRVHAAPREATAELGKCDKTAGHTVPLIQWDRQACTRSQGDPISSDNAAMRRRSAPSHTDSESSRSRSRAVRSSSSRSAGAVASRVPSGSVGRRARSRYAAGEESTARSGSM